MTTALQHLRPSGWPGVAHTRQLPLSVCVSLPPNFRYHLFRYLRGDHYSIPYITASRAFGQTFFVAYDALGVFSAVGTVPQGRVSGFDAVG
jgi:hypothetical protein